MDLTPQCNCQFGAPMGRRTWNGNTAPYAGRMYLRRIRLDRGGYDSGGAYWGVGQRLYGYAAEDDSVNGFVRANDWEDAKARVRRLYPLARFFA